MSSSLTNNKEKFYQEFFTQNSDIIKFKFLGKSDLNDRNRFLCDDIRMRILLISNYMPDKERDKLFYNYLDNCSCPNAQKCMLHRIRELIARGIGLQSTEKDSFKSRTYWDEKVDAYCLHRKLRIEDVWGKDGLAMSKKGIDAGKELTAINSPVQIVHVGDFESALVLLSCCKFDIVLLDDKRLFTFLSIDEQEFDNPNNILEELGISTVKNDEKGNAINRPLSPNLLKEFRNNVKLNRGPLDKYWILPLNESFYDEMRINDIQMTDHRWNVAFGVDPYTHPWEFLYRINEFINLQLRLSVYNLDTLMRFLLYTCVDMRVGISKMLNDEGGKRKKIADVELCFEGFQDFMGAEYSNFMKRYGAKKLIERDAIKGDDVANKSLFSTFVKQSFYYHFPMMTELNRLMCNFYHQAATMFNDRYGRQRLRESFEALRNFIAYNGLLENSLKEKERNDLKDGLILLRTVIDSDFYLSKIEKWMDKNK